MNGLLAPHFSTHVHRLALGLETLDAARDARIAHPIRVEIEGTAAVRARHRVDRHDSCLHALLYRPGLGSSVDIRLVESARRFVPRRLRVPLPDLEADDNPPPSQRSRRPMLFPGAAYDVGETATALRGRAVRDDSPLRWARVEATRPDSGLVVGRAHGDDRGEFLLLLAPAAMQVGELVTPLPIQVTVFAPTTAPSPPAADGASDPLWDLPLEELPDAALPDTVASGEELPPDYDATTTRIVEFIPGRILSSDIDEFTIP